MNTVKQEKVSPPSSEDSKQQKPKGSEKNYTIGDYHTAPGYMKDNQHITHGYRINFDNPKKIFRSLFMIHNESFNIWSHCLTAMIVVIAIISFALIVDKTEIISNLNTFQKQMTSSFQNYKNALDNLTLIQNMKHMREITQIELQELRQNAIQQFSIFTQKLNKNMENMKQFMQFEVQGLKQSFHIKIKENLQKMSQMKNDFEKIIAPSLVSQINSLNNTYINNIKQQMTSLKQQIDSHHYDYIDVLHDTPNPQHISRWPIMVFLSSALVCLLCSTLFHLFYPMSSKSYAIFSRFDYAGISVLIAGSTFPPFYYGMYCYFEVAIVYEVIQMTLAISIFILSVFEWMHRPEHVRFKAFIYGGFGLFNIIPISHLMINDIFFDKGDGFSFISSLPYYFLLGASYLLGLYIYTIRCPERHYPGKFNLCGHSHQIWHIFVVLGIIFTYLGSLQLFEMRKNNACPVREL